jgi:hypothetical protein
VNFGKEHQASENPVQGDAPPPSFEGSGSQ